MRPDVRDRLVLPLLLPVVIVAIIAGIATLFGMIMFFNPMIVSATLAVVVAAGILAAFGMASAKPELPRAKGAVVVGAAVIPLVLGALVAAGVVEPSDERVVERECEFCLRVPDGAVQVTAENLQFDTDTLVLPAHGDASILFINSDLGIPHNIAIYPEDESGVPLLDAPIFDGEVITGEDEHVYTFTAPETPGTYHFQCDVHPVMHGEALFDEAKA
jgi:plastocyanin